MEDLIVSAKAHKLLKKFQKRLENRYCVQIRMPKDSSLESDVIFISLYGEEQNRDCVKKFLSEKMNVSTKNDESEVNVILITLSDSEEEPAIADDSVCIIESSENSPKLSNALSDCKDKTEDPGSIIESSTSSKISSGITRNVFSLQTKCQEKKEKFRNDSKKIKKVRSKAVLPSSSDAEASELCEVTSTTDDVVTKKRKLTNKIKLCDVSEHEFSGAATSVESPADFIPLCNQNKCHKESETDKTTCTSLLKQDRIINDDIIVIEEPVSISRCLRPVVIDGSNVAMEHGRISHSFSAKGIQLAIDYFLSRGHTQVTAFVPKFRRFANPNHNCPTTDPEILENLAAKQLVVFTPSRRVNGKCIASYDDRFIVQLAATNGGVIVSNDNFRDLINESESFKEAIEQRLLMYCFVGDVFMVPNDPLGRNGPSLNDYLCFPPDDTKNA